MKDDPFESECADEGAEHALNLNRQVFIIWRAKWSWPGAKHEVVASKEARTLQIMKHTKVAVAIPYAVEFVRRGCRNIEGLVVWDEGAVAICEADLSDASVAFNIRASGKFGRSYDILSFGGKLWWPLYQKDQPVSVDAFIRAVGDPDGCFMAAMNLSPATLHSSRDHTTARFEADLSIRRVHASSLSVRWTSAQRAASRLLFCGGFVYQEGGNPAYFAVESDDVPQPRLTLRIGGLRTGGNHPGDRWHLGLSARKRTHAALRSLVFHVDDIDSTCLALKAEGYHPVIEETAIATGGPFTGIGPVEFCAEAVARAILMPSAQTSENYRATLETLASMANVGHPMPISISRAIISEGLLNAPTLPEKAFGIGEKWALKALEQIDQQYPPTLTFEEDQAIFRIGID
jgi:hypothetical protein